MIVVLATLLALGVASPHTPCFFNSSLELPPFLRGNFSGAYSDGSTSVARFNVSCGTIAPSNGLVFQMWARLPAVPVPAGFALHACVRVVGSNSSALAVCALFAPRSFGFVDAAFTDSAVDPDVCPASLGDRKALIGWYKRID